MLNSRLFILIFISVA
uniref:Uncharacterized protein n=1 Tax=Arundo donax TaxID=35708 RepID=A0A0A9ACM8_ARUDO